MKIAASEAQWDTCQPCGFSLIPVRRLHARSDQTPSFSITIPSSSRTWPTGSFDGEVQGLNQLQSAGAAEVRPAATTSPNVRVIVLVDAGDGLRRGC